MPVLPRAARLLVVAAVALPLGLAAAALPTGTASAADPTVPLGTAGAFAVLGGSTVTSTGSTVLTGDLGVSPATAITGFPPGLVVGTVHAADGVAQAAQADLTTAYLDAAGRPSTGIVPQLQGVTLVAGTYASGTLALDGTLTLDAQGDPDAVFVLQAGSTFVTGSASRVLLVNGAQACRVFFQVGSSATLGTGSSLAGTVLALTSITAGTGSRVEGRLLARNGAVTLDSTVVSRPSCALAASPAPTASPTVPPSASPSASPTSSPSATVSPAPVVTTSPSGTPTVGASRPAPAAPAVPSPGPTPVASPAPAGPATPAPAAPGTPAPAAPATPALPVLGPPTTPTGDSSGVVVAAPVPDAPGVPGTPSVQLPRTGSSAGTTALAGLLSIGLGLLLLAGGMPSLVSSAPRGAHRRPS